MPYLVNIGTGGRIIKENKSGIGSRGYHIYRRGKTVICRWGGVLVGKGRIFTWSGTPSEKRYNYRTTYAAELFLAEQVRRLLLPHEAYRKLASGARINKTLTIKKEYMGSNL